MNTSIASAVRFVPISMLAFLLTVSPALAKSTQNVKLHVDAGSAPGGDGSGGDPFRNLPEALAHARSLSQGGIPRITIKVAPGTYLLDETLRLDVPELELQGSNEPQRDGDGWPTGVVEPGTETKVATTVTITGSMISVMAHGVTIRNLTVNRPDAKGDTLRINRVQRFTVKDSCLTGPAAFAISASASSGVIVGNFITEAGCGACLAAGNAGSPAHVEFTGNRLVKNTLGGVLLAGGIQVDGAGVFDSLSAIIKGNDLSRNNANPAFSFGLRVFMIRRDPPDPFLQQEGQVTAEIADNRVHDNAFGVIIDAGFPYRTFLGVPDDRPYTGSFDLSFANNDVAGNRAPALITFTRSSAALNRSQLIPAPAKSSFKYLVDSVFTIKDPQANLSGYWLDHPETDPISGVVLLNTLTINGIEVPRGRVGIP